MKIDFLTLFPEMFEGVLGSSILQKAQEKDAVQFQVVNFREYLITSTILLMIILMAAGQAWFSSLSLFLTRSRT